MKPETVIGGVRDHIRASVPVVDLPTVHYPAPPELESSPSCVLFWGGDEETTIAHRPGGLQEWTIPILARLLIDHQGATPAEFARLDALAVPLIDAFTVGYGIGNINDIIAGLGGHLRSAQILRGRQSLQTEYAGEACYASDWFITVKFDRRAGT